VSHVLADWEDTFLPEKLGTSDHWHQQIEGAKVDWANHVREMSQDQDAEEEEEDSEAGEAPYLFSKLSRLGSYSEMEGVKVDVPDPRFVDSEGRQAGDDKFDPVAATTSLLESTVRQLQGLAAAIPLVSEGVLEHVEPTIADLIAGLNDVGSALSDLSSAVGDVDAVARAGYPDMAEGILGALRSAGKGDLLTELRVRVEDLEGVIPVVEKNMKDSMSKSILSLAQKMGLHLKGAVERIAQLESSSPRAGAGGHAPNSGRVGFGRSLATPSNNNMSQYSTQALTFDTQGVPLMSMGDLIQDVMDLKSEVVKLRSCVTAQGGVVLGLFTCPSEAEFRSIVLREAPTGRGFAAFVDPMSLFAHDVESDTSGGLHKMLSSAGLTRATDRRYVMSFTKRYSAKYVGSDSNPKLGKKISVFENEDIWRGVGGLDGEREVIAKCVTLATQAALTYARDNLPRGQLLDLACDMIQDSGKFHTAMHVHFERELIKLTQLKVEKNEALKLVSNQYMLICNK
jgi:hypothetical protein